MGLITPDLSGLVDGQTADASDVKNPLNTIINEFNGNISGNNLANNTITGQKIVNSVALTTPAITSPTFIGTVDGWVNPNDTWTYASATTITVSSGAASIYSVGDKIKLTQTTVKYFYITAVADTLLTITGGTDYTLTNATISLNYYSHESSPVGFPGRLSFSSVPTPSVGAITTVTTTRNSMSMNGRKVTVEYDFTITTNGTGSGYLNIPLPINSDGLQSYSATGKDPVNSGKAFGGTIDSVSPTKIILLDYNNSYPIGGNGARMVVHSDYYI